MTHSYPQPGGGYPPPKPPRRRGPWVIAAVAGLIVIAVIAFVFIKGGKGHWPIGATDASGESSSTTATAGPSGGTYVLDPLSKLPTADEIEQVTLLSVKPASVPYSIAAPDTKASPPNCALADHPTSNSAWGTAQFEAGQLYTDGTMQSYQNTVGTDLAVFATAADAAESLKKITDSVKSCTTRWTTPSASGATASSVLSVHEITNGIVWADNTLDVERPWVCSMAYKIESNLASSSVICGLNETDSPAKLVDLTLAKAIGRS